MTPTDQSSPPPPAFEAAARGDWPAYFDRMATSPPRATLMLALELFDGAGGPVPPSAGRVAVDLGCGHGADTEELVRRGWRVLAMDGSEEGLERLRAREACARALGEGRLEVVRAGFEAMEFGACDLVNASFALPFCPPEVFVGLWSRVEGAVRCGGRFAGQFFGDRDDWASLPGRTHLTRAGVLGLLEGWVLERLEEEDRPSKRVGGLSKHWHVFHMVARKRG